MGKAKEKLIVKVGKLYVRDHPARFQGDYTLTAKEDRAAIFHVDDVPVRVAQSLIEALGVRAEVLPADVIGKGAK
jgi:hypothetical protein